MYLSKNILQFYHESENMAIENAAKQEIIPLGGGLVYSLEL